MMRRSPVDTFISKLIGAFMALMLIVIVGAGGVWLVGDNAVKNVELSQKDKRLSFLERYSQFKISNREDHSLDIEIMQKELEELRKENVALQDMLKTAGKELKKCPDDSLL